MNDERVVLRVPISILAPEVQQYMNDRIVQSGCKVQVHSVDVHSELEDLVIVLSRLQKPDSSS